MLRFCTVTFSLLFRYWDFVLYVTFLLMFRCWDFVLWQGSPRPWPYNQTNQEHRSTFAPIGEWKCNLPPFLGNYDRPTDRTTNSQTGGVIGKLHFKNEIAVKQCYDFCLALQRWDQAAVWLCLPTTQDNWNLRPESGQA